jgi:hypothetical protein
MEIFYMLYIYLIKTNACLSTLILQGVIILLTKGAEAKITQITQAHVSSFKFFKEY